MNNTMLFYSAAVQVFITLLPVINPIGMSAIVIGLTKSYSKQRYNHIVRKIAVNVFVLLTVFLLCGNYLLMFFQLKIAFVSIAGGLVVFNAAWQMLGEEKPLTDNEEKEASDRKDLSFFPLTLPITSGPGALAIILTLSTTYQKNTILENSILLSGAIVGLLMLSIVIYLCYRYAAIIFSFIGVTGTNVVSRISAFILLAISTQIFWRGLSKLIYP